MSESEEFCIPCVDNDDWEPTPEELEAAYVQLEKGAVLELEWKCPARRAPESNLPEEEPPQTAEQSEKEIPNAPINKEFDFMDETPLTSTQIRVRTPNATPKKKKTTNFAGVLDTMKKHGRFMATAPNAGGPSSVNKEPLSEN
ncbi:PAXIP1-associated glutamate-rich protein 1 [Lutzomyia longipalpis]|uniref:PAXIP1-associated glutamate-rich protein 1 n=1 Tax=Lutzomyia longipalpis TaxID=7200 RepID=UPI0024838544|nr:PAXIP1-associated glutamate-rich protein 1 [Lutzomyia longipalpis]